MKALSNLRAFAAKRAAYRRTLRELRAMPLDVAIDLDLDLSKASRIARDAVYGA